MHKAASLPPHVGLCVFDIETDGLYRQGENAPNLICTAAVEITPTGQKGKYTTTTCQTWPQALHPSPTLISCGIEARPMNTREIMDFVDYLINACSGPRRLRLAGWNAVGFDIKVLAAHCRQIAATHELETVRQQASAMFEKLEVLAWDCTDPMLNFFMCKGFPIRLAAVAATLPNALVKNGEGANAANDWLHGSNQDRLNVIQYCANDCLMTAAVLSQLDYNGELRWISRKEKQNTWKPPMGVRTLLAPAYEAFTWKFPDNSWLKKRPREIQHTAGKELRQENSEREIGSNESVDKVQTDDLPKPSNYFWMQK